MHKNKKPTIKDIARESGFSHATVSRVLNKKGKFYSEETSKKIEKVAKRLNYTPNAMARYLKKRRTKIIAYLVPESHSFYFLIYNGIRKVAKEYGYNIMIMISDYDKEREISNIKTLLENRVDGIIIASMMVNERQITMLRDSGLSIVLVDREENYKNISNVVINNEEVSFLGTSHLIELGHEKIAYISGPLDILNYNKRFLGYKRALRENKVEFDNSLVFIMEGLKWLVTYGRDYEIIKNIIENNKEITALFIISATLPVIAVKAVRDFCLEIPQDIAILGFNEIPISKYIVPPISSIVLPTEEMGCKAMNILLRMIKDSQYQEFLELKSELVVRESTGISDKKVIKFY
jgi:LacI family transcriptional regulator